MCSYVVGRCGWRLRGYALLLAFGRGISDYCGSTSCVEVGVRVLSRVLFLGGYYGYFFSRCTFIEQALCFASQSIVIVFFAVGRIVWFGFRVSWLLFPRLCGVFKDVFEDLFGPFLDGECLVLRLTTPARVICLFVVVWVGCRCGWRPPGMGI